MVLRWPLFLLHTARNHMILWKNKKDVSTKAINVSHADMLTCESLYRHQFTTEVSASVNATPPTSSPPPTLISQKMSSPKSNVVLTPSAEMILKVQLKCLGAVDCVLITDNTPEKDVQSADLGAIVAAHTDYPVPLQIHQIQQNIKAP